MGTILQVLLKINTSTNMKLINLCQILVLILNEHICQNSGERRLPLIIQGPILSNDVIHDLPPTSEEGGSNDSEPRPIIENIDIKSNITNRFEKTSIKCFVKNPSIRISREIDFEIELSSYKYNVTSMTLGIHGDNSIYKATHNKDAEMIHDKLSERKQSVVKIKELKNGKTSSKEAMVLGMSAIIPPGEKFFITVEYEGPLINIPKNTTKYNQTWSHVVRINPQQLVQNFNVTNEITETLPIVNVLATVVKDKLPDFELSRSNIKYGNTSNSVHVSFYPNESDKQDGGYDINKHFYTNYSRDKNFLLREVGQDITDIASPEKINLAASTIINGMDFMFNIIPMIVIPMILPMMIIPIMMIIPMMMIPMMILPIIPIVSMMDMVMSVFPRGTDEWFLNNKMWYEKEIAYEFENFDNIMDRMDGFENKNIFEDIFEYSKFDKPVKTRRVVISFSSEPNNQGNSTFINYKKVLEETPQKVDDSVAPQSHFVKHEEPKARKF